MPQSLAPRWVAFGLSAVLVAGCAGRRGPTTAAEPAEPPATQVPAPPPNAVDREPPDVTTEADPGEGGVSELEAEPAAAAASTAPQKPHRPLRELCRVGTSPDENGILHTSKRVLEETFCGATLWFDGLFGGEPDVQNARDVHGRVELATLYTREDGYSVKPRLRLDYDLPTLERRFKVFLGRDDRDEFVEDRREGLGIRSSIYNLENEDQWLAGLGYSLPGRWADKVDFRVGGRLKTSPEVFTQVRFRKHWFVGDAVVVRFRETGFWQNREDGFGSTTSLDIDRVLSPTVLVRAHGSGTISQATDGAAYRAAGILYHNMGRHAGALAYEVFMRGETAADVPLREWGGRTIYRHRLGRYDWLFGELILGYTFPRRDLADEREGSTMIGFGVELYFGRDTP